MTYLPDSVLVEKVALAIANASEPLHPLTVEGYRNLPARDRAFYEKRVHAALSVACPLVAGVIANRLDEEQETAGAKFGWEAATFVRSEFVDGEA